MMKKVIEKVVTNYGVRLEINFGTVNNYLYFNDDAEMKGFVFMLHMMTSMDAASVELNVPDEEQPESEEAPAKADGQAAEE